MYLDIGAKNFDDAAKRVQIGDMCVFATPPVINGDHVFSPALDDRIGCFIMAETLRQIQSGPYDVYFVFTTQEEVGCRGAKTSAFAIEPDYGLAFDVTYSADTPKARPSPAKMYGGAAIKIKDASVICHPAINKHLEACAKNHAIPYQYEILEWGGTDSGSIHLTKGGVPSGVISVPTRYVHTANEMCALSDVEHCIALAVAALSTELA
jgi:endoglucanase